MFIFNKIIDVIATGKKKISPFFFFGFSCIYFIVECCLDLNCIVGEEGPLRTLSITPHGFL